MPRKKKTIVEETLPDDAPNTDDFTDAICVVSKVHKLNAGMKSFCFQTTEPVDEVSIQAQYPSGGKFVVTEFNSLNQPIRTEHYEIEPRPLTPNQNGNNGYDDIRTRMLMDELNFTRNMMLKMIDGLANGKAQQQATPFGELVEGMRLMNEISPKNTPVDLILKGMELGQKSNGSSDWKTELVSAAKELVPAVAPIFTPRQNPIQGNAPMLTASPTAMMKQGIDWLKPQIVSGMTADLAIGWVIQNSKDPLCNQLIANAIKGDVNTFIEIDPEIANEPYRGWFETAIQLLKEEYAAAQGRDTSDNARGNRDDSDFTDDAPTGTKQSKISKVG